MSAVCRIAMVVATCTFGWVGSASGQDFFPLGDLPGGLHLSEAVAVSNGLSPVVVGNSAVAGGQMQAFIWTESGGMTSIAPGFISSTAQDVSADGSVVVGWYVDDSDPKAGNMDIAFAWQSGVGLTPLPNLPHDPERPDFARAHGISADGDTIVGRSAAGIGFDVAACAWIGGAPIQLNELGGGQLSSAALAVSSDGSTAVGTGFSGAGQREIRWAGVSPQDLGAGSGAIAVSGDGSVVGGPQGIWTVGDGWTNVGATVRGINDDASIFVGGDSFAAIYSPCLGGDELQSFLEEFYGMDFGGWELLIAHGISRDGKSIVGVGENPSGDSEAWLVTLPLGLNDIDGDGIPNEHECNGIDVDDDGEVDLDLPAMGANPLRKDLFVEVDIMSGLSFPELARNQVIQAFANAPISNPDGSTGISLHIQLDETLPNDGTWTTVGDWPPAFGAVKGNHFGTTAEQGNALLLEAKRAVFRYCIAADSLDNGWLGVAEIFGDDSIVLFGTPYLTNGSNDNEEKAAVFMHELGHNLGLEHGGDDEVNGKPNYVSVMNYVMTCRAAWNTNFWSLDYSRAKFPADAIDEQSLNENDGIDSGGVYDHVWMPYGYETSGIFGTEIRSHTMVRLNGRATDFGRLVPFNDGVLDGITTSVGVKQDLNFISEDTEVDGLTEFSPDECLFGFNDWANIDIIIPTPPTGQYVDGVQTNLPSAELTSVAATWLDANLNPPPFPCAADIDGSDVVDVSDLLLLLASWGPCTNPCVADTDNNEVVDVTDLLAVLAGWGPCPEP